MKETEHSAQILMSVLILNLTIVMKMHFASMSWEATLANANLDLLVTKSTEYWHAWTSTNVRTAQTTAMRMLYVLIHQEAMNAIVYRDTAELEHFVWMMM